MGLSNDLLVLKTRLNRKKEYFLARYYHIFPLMVTQVNDWIWISIIDAVIIDEFIKQSLRLDIAVIELCRTT